MDCAVSKGDNLGGDPFIHQTQGSGKVAHHPQKPSQHLAHHQPLPDHCEQGGGGGHVMSRSAPIGQMTLPLGPDGVVSPGCPRDNSPGTGLKPSGGNTTNNNTMESPPGHHGNMSPMPMASAGGGGHSMSPFGQNSHGYGPPPGTHRGHPYPGCSTSNMLVTGSMYSDINPLDHHTAHVQTHCMPSHPTMNGPINCSMSTGGYSQTSYDYIPKLTHL